MAEEPKNIDQGRAVISWEIPEFDKHDRTRRWYIAASLVAAGLLLYAFFTNNFLFAVIIVAAAVLIILADGQEPMLVNVSLNEHGLTVGRKFYDYDQIKNFSIVYKPNYNVKNLYFEFKSAVKPRLSIPLINSNPLPIRQNLLKYLPEDLDRTDMPLSEVLARLFKL